MAIWHTGVYRKSDGYMPFTYEYAVLSKEELKKTAVQNFKETTVDDWECVDLGEDEYKRIIADKIGPPKWDIDLKKTVTFEAL